jgi:hypothetical protein
MTDLTCSVRRYRYVQVYGDVVTDLLHESNEGDDEPEAMTLNAAHIVLGGALDREVNIQTFKHANMIVSGLEIAPYGSDGRSKYYYCHPFCHVLVLLATK